MFQAFGHLSAQMLVHILLMNAVAPLLALAAPAAWFRSRPAWRDGLFPAMLAQLGALWAWHSPPVLDAVLRSDALHLAMQASLFSLAMWF
ncbi:MAG TPA: cytochrome c oxidase assembly protein, partial [Woeseiaceae bacterium]|nr:cytochrome c oxidase assembly protein [Woeseiaceae bacterium]